MPQRILRNGISLNPFEEYLNQFTAEHKVLVRNRNTGKAKEVWQKKKAAVANHYLDAEVYAVSAADIIRALNIRKDGAARVHQQIISSDHSRSGWIKKRDGAWL